ncbi:MAG TPA: FAD-linked oxidase C-terminal domain-containing protein, partial [Bauldia sp.]|nr:FAD-linked oxidase C-terminal domain-containing protein [Bauldia sp.]
CRDAAEVARPPLAFEPLAAPLLALSARVKAAFDPKGILNPGRFYP